MPAQVVGRHIFYQGSAWGETIAPDKSALLPGQTAAFANYISYDGGIKGLFVDVADLADPGAVSAADFLFAQGNDDRPVYWGPANGPPDSVSVAVGAGVDGSDRIKLLWSASACDNSRWLEVTVLANANTGLASDDVHYWGLAIGDTGDRETDAIVDYDDIVEIQTRVSPTPVEIGSPWDVNRDKYILFVDVYVAYMHLTDAETCLRLITPALWRFTGRSVAGRVCVIGREAGRAVVIGQEAGHVCVIGQEAGRAVVIGQEAGQVCVIGQQAGKIY